MGPGRETELKLNLTFSIIPTYQGPFIKLAMYHPREMLYEKAHVADGGCRNRTITAMALREIFIQYATASWAVVTLQLLFHILTC